MFYFLSSLLEIGQLETLSFDVSPLFQTPPLVLFKRKKTPKKVSEETELGKKVLIFFFGKGGVGCEGWQRREKAEKRGREKRICRNNCSIFKL